MPPTHQPHDLPTSDHIGDDGKVRYWNIPDRKWDRAAPVDVREIISVGSGSMHGPDVEMTNTELKKTEVFCASEVAALEAQGWKKTGRIGGDVQNPPKEPKGAGATGGSTTGGSTAGGGTGGGTDDNPPPYDFTKHKLSELQQFAQEAQIDFDGLNKSQIIEQLDKANFRPKAAG